MGNLGIAELAFIFFVGLLVLGPKRLPEAARGIGEAFRSFQDAMRGIQRPMDVPPERDEPQDVSEAEEKQ